MQEQRLPAESGLHQGERWPSRGSGGSHEAPQAEGAPSEREARQAFWLRLGDALRPLADSAAILEEAARVLGEFLQADRVMYGEVEGPDDGVFTVRREYCRAGTPSAVGRQRFDDLGSSVTETLRSGRTLVVADVLDLPEHTPADRATHSAMAIRSYLAVPLVKEGRIDACLAVNQRLPREWSAREVELVEETAERTWSAVERSRVEAALRQSEERFRLMADAIPQIVWITDAEGRTEFFNKQWTYYTGVPYEATTAATIASSFVHPDDAVRTMDAFTEARRLGRTFEVEHRIRSAQGTYRWFLVRAEPFRDPQTGEILRWFGASTDIHDRKLAEAALRASEARQGFLLQLTDRLRPLVDAADIQYQAVCALGEHLGVSRIGYAEDAGDGESIIISHNYTTGVQGVEGRYRYADYGAGLLRELRSGCTVVCSDVAADPTLTAAEKAAYAALQIDATVTVPLVKASRLVAVLFVHHWEARAWSADELALLEETAERTWAAVERARAEEAQRLAVERYERQVRLFEGVASTTPDFVYLFDLQGRFRYANRRLLEVWGMTLPEIVGKTCRELGYEQWHHDMHMREIAQVIATKQSVKGEVPFKAPLTGVFGIYEYIFTPVIGPDGEVELIAGTTRDITEHKQAEDALQEAARRKDEFLATLAHELRNPLAPIVNAVEVLRLRADDPAAVERARDTIRRQAEHMRHLIDDLLDVARITRGMVGLQLREVDLGLVITGAVQMVRPLIDRRGQSFQVSVPPTPVRLQGDPHRLTQVVTNLLNNAAKFTPPGGRIAVTAEHQGAEVVIRVQDSGKGIPAEMLPYVFDLFTQVNPSIDRAEGGLGLGLTLVQKLVEMHGGRVEAHSAGPGQGSEFVVRLPAPPQGPETDGGTVAVRSAPAPQPLRILVVDDNVDAADTLAELLPIWGHRVRVAYSGPEALAATRDYRPDVVLLDIGLPGMDGYLVAQQIRSDPEVGSVHLIAVTGFGQEEDRRRAREVGFDEHLTKPVDPDQLRRVLESLQLRNAKSTVADPLG